MANAHSHASNNLSAIAIQTFGKLSDAESLVISAAENGECITCDAALAQIRALPDPEDAKTWGSEFQVRAALIRWLCVSPVASKMVVPRGIQVLSSNIKDPLDLTGVTVPFPLTFLGCRLGEIDLRYSNILLLNLSRCVIEALNADGAQVKTMLTLRGFSATTVRLLGASVGASLDLQEARLNTVHVAFNADRLEVKGDVVLVGASFDGDFLMREGQIGGMLDCHRAKFADVDLQRARIGSVIFWHSVERCTSLDLSRTSAGSLSDDVDSWANTREFRVDGFVYEQMLGTDTPTDAETRLRWLERQLDFSPQSYSATSKSFT